MAKNNKINYSNTMQTTPIRRITTQEVFEGKKLKLRLLTLGDCNERYVSWLQDPQVNQYLETRWTAQSLETIKMFVSEMVSSPHSYLFAIHEISNNQHIGNIKIGPINFHHSTAEISYFIGEKSYWGKGFASDAITVASNIAYKKLNLHCIRAGLYASNIGSAKALEKAGYKLEGISKEFLVGENGREDQFWYGKVSPTKNS